MLWPSKIVVFTNIVHDFGSSQGSYRDYVNHIINVATMVSLGSHMKMID